MPLILGLLTPISVHFRTQLIYQKPNIDGFTNVKKIDKVMVITNIAPVIFGFLISLTKRFQTSFIIKIGAPCRDRTDLFSLEG